MDAAAEKNMAVVMDFITAVRNLRTELGLPPGRRVQATIVCRDRHIAGVLEGAVADMVRLARLSGVQITETRPEQDSGSAAVVRGQEIIILAEEEAVDKGAEVERLTKELAKVTAERDKVEKKLGNPQFVEKAPEEVVRKNRGILEELQAQKGKLEENLERLND
jgi:valyl-tRNA synthetase